MLVWAHAAEEWAMAVALDPALNPATAGAGCHRQRQPTRPRRVQQLGQAGPQRQRIAACEIQRALTFAQADEVKRTTGQRRQISIQIDLAMCAQVQHPALALQLVTVLAIQLVQHLELDRLCVEDQAIEVENEGLDGHCNPCRTYAEAFIACGSMVLSIFVGLFSPCRAKKDLQKGKESRPCVRPTFSYQVFIAHGRYA